MLRLQVSEQGLFNSLMKRVYDPQVTYYQSGVEINGNMDGQCVVLSNCDQIKPDDFTVALLHRQDTEYDEFWIVLSSGLTERKKDHVRFLVAEWQQAEELVGNPIKVSFALGDTAHRGCEISFSLDTAERGIPLMSLCRTLVKGALDLEYVA